MPAATVRRAPYKDFLQPALHRRFASTALTLIGIAYAESLLLANWNYWFWSWFPLSATGFRCGVFFVCGLMIITLRIAQYHVGIRTSDSPLQTASQYTLRIQTIETGFAYIFSAWMFGQVCLLSASESAQLQWINYYSGDRARVNEKPLFFITHLMITGAIQATLHLVKDKDRLLLGTVKTVDNKNGSSSNEPMAYLTRLGEALPSHILESLTQAAVSLVVSLFLYPLFLRSLAWSSALTFFRLFYNIPKANMLPSSVPYKLTVLVRCLFHGTMLVLLWRTANTAFSKFMVKTPFKEGKPLTTEAKDPNGSLINGLKSKKQPIKAFAMWELAFIARDYEDRRKLIYEDIDRKDGSAWSQVYAQCMGVIKEIETRIDTYGKPPAAAQPAPNPAPAENSPRILPALKDDPITSTPPKKSFRDEVEKVVGNAITDKSGSSQLSPLAKKLVDDTKGRLRDVQQKATGKDDPEDPMQNGMRWFLSSILGYPIRQDFRRRLNAAVLGGPYGEPSLYINAASAISQLSVHSLGEDKYGNVQRDVAGCIRTLTSLVKKLEAFVAGFPLHWTDIAEKRSSPEVDQVLEAFREALGQVASEFAPFARELRLGLSEVRTAKEVAGLNREQEEERPQMQQIRSGR